MAEGLWNQVGGGGWQAHSAGSRPAGYVHPLAIRAMQELGLDIAANRSKSLDEFARQEFDLVVTVCDHARDSCPVWTGARQTLHVPFDDPAHATGSEAEQMQEFRRVRDEIQAWIRGYLENSA